MDRLLEPLTHAFERNALHDGVEETFDDQLLGFLLRDSSGFEIKQGFLL